MVLSKKGNKLLKTLFKIRKEERALKKWEEREEITTLREQISRNKGLTKEERINFFWKRYSKAIRPGIEAEDRFQSESIGRAFTKVVGN